MATLPARLALCSVIVIELYLFIPRVDHVSDTEPASVEVQVLAEWVVGHGGGVT